MKTQRVVRPVNNACSPRELVAARLVRPVNKKSLTCSPRELVTAVFAPNVVRPVNTLKVLPGHVRVSAADPGSGLPLQHHGGQIGERSTSVRRTVMRSHCERMLNRCVRMLLARNRLLLAGARLIEHSMSAHRPGDSAAAAAEGFPEGFREGFRLCRWLISKQSPKLDFAKPFPKPYAERFRRSRSDRTALQPGRHGAGVPGCMKGHGMQVASPWAPGPC